MGLDGGWTPQRTRPQRYCDPASLVVMSETLDKMLSDKVVRNNENELVSKHRLLSMQTCGHIPS